MNILEGEIEKRKEAEEPRTGGKREGPELAGRARDDETCRMGRAPFPLMRRFSEKNPSCSAACGALHSSLGPRADFSEPFTAQVMEL